MGKIFFILGRSASGKDHLYQALLEDASLGLRRMVLYTTRPIRAGEVDGETYHFIDVRQLDRLRGSGKVIEERTYETVAGPWTYLTADEGIDPNENYVIIGTLESFRNICAYYGEKRVFPIFVSSTEEHLLERSLKREKMQEQPNYRELCRRFLADSEDYANEKIREAGITEVFANDGTMEEFLSSVRERVKAELRLSDL
ncbi:MAG: guanylate kinase [Lachnospiraceae bacterium]